MIFFLKANKDRSTEGSGHGKNKILDPVPDPDPDPDPVFPKGKNRIGPKIISTTSIHLALSIVRTKRGEGDSHLVGHVKVGEKIPGLDDGAEFLPLFRQRIHTYHTMLSMEQVKIQYFTGTS
jgi:hypothetical protein